MEGDFRETEEEEEGLRGLMAMTVRETLGARGLYI